MGRGSRGWWGLELESRGGWERAQGVLGIGVVGSGSSGVIGSGGGGVVDQGAVRVWVYGKGSRGWWVGDLGESVQVYGVVHLDGAI